MQQFKNGDWVRKLSNNKIYYIDGESFRAFDICINEAQLNGYELWQPKEGEWCIFVMNADESSLRQWTNSHIDNNQLKTGMCEPFIGELPSWIKETK